MRNEQDRPNGTQGCEALVRGLYDRHSGTAERFGYTFRRESVSPGGTPMVLFAGNHSSGKSTFINGLVGADVQDTGVAPTDDSFTFLVHGESDGETVGAAAIDALPRELKRLEEFGPSLVARIRVRTRNLDALRDVTLVDTPGMIDSGDKSFSRGYDFFGVLAFLAEVSDLVLMMFDPEKPGTTGEAVEALKGPLSGSFFKLRILFNKCDLFSGIYDYARAYGALCWNLARVLPFKDLPKIYNCRLPVAPPSNAKTIDLADFDRLREEIVGEIRSAGEKRSDNIRMAVAKDLSCLEMHVRMALRIRRALARRLLGSRLLSAGVAVLLAAAGVAVGEAWGVSVSTLHGSLAAKGLFAVQCIAIAAFAAFAGFAARGISRMEFNRYLKRIFADDSFFQAEYVRELSLGGRDDLAEYWQMVKPPLERLVEVRWRELPRFGFFALRRLRADILRIKG